MAKGNVSSAVATIEEKKRGFAESGDRPRFLYFKLQDGESATVRFLEEESELHWSWVHQLPATGNYKFGPKIPCRDQGEDGEPIGEACPGCERGYKRTFQGVVNILWRDAPIFERDESNRLVRDGFNNPVVSGRADQNAIWVAGVTVFEDLEELASTYNGLTSRDFLIKRRGEKLNTRYTISPADPDGGPQKLAKADLALADSKYDLTQFVVAPTYDAWGSTKIAAQDDTEAIRSSTSSSPFKRNR